jgi:hypothetical protein
MNTNAGQYEARKMLALIALATEVPVPKNISFHPNGELLSLTFERLSAGLAWSSYLGGQLDTYVHNAARYLNEGVIDWHGWRVQLHACDLVEPVEASLAQDITDGLAALTQA